ncbi:aromatic ring-opening dioxygenase [Nitzschia inconspicua]|uniref:Aromatic ring-opening dioxygenase n=1 Tax=Nitzschia inconspicua TaxID=303405 RepID=A0A9K3Q0C1_9STRA|nr:aromatic ring-opening dioxygenase [Nitzschia inconspicua]
MKYPTVFINHGGGPLPIMGRQPDLVKNMKNVVANLLPRQPPSAIVILSAHWESDPVSITSSPKPSLLFDYSGFPRETYEYEYPAPGNPNLAQRIQDLLSDQGISSRLDDERGFDHGVFVPLMIMYPSAEIPVVQISLDASLDSRKNMEIGRALTPLRDDDILILGSGYSFHNMGAFFQPSERTIQGSIDFNEWLKGTILPNGLENWEAMTPEQRIKQYDQCMEAFENWELAPGARISHPREEHLLPLFMVAAAGGKAAKPRLIYDSTTSSSRDFGSSEHAVTGYLFE